MIETICVSWFCTVVLSCRDSRHTSWELSGLQNPSGAAIRLGGRMLSHTADLLRDIGAAAEYLALHPTEVP
jgi:hypothetical protein